MLVFEEDATMVGSIVEGSLLSTIMSEKEFHYKGVLPAECKDEPVLITGPIVDSEESQRDSGCYMAGTS